MGDFCGQNYFNVRSNSIAARTSSGEERYGKKRSANLSSSFLFSNVFSLSFAIFTLPPVFNYNLTHQNFSVNRILHFLAKIVRLKATKSYLFQQKKENKNEKYRKFMRICSKKAVIVKQSQLFCINLIKRSPEPSQPQLPSRILRYLRLPYSCLPYRIPLQRFHMP